MGRRLAKLAAMAGLWTALSAGVAVARDPDPALRIPLDTMGYQAMVAEFLLSGSSMLTIDFVDQDHLLVTFTLRRLMKREANDPVDDEDRTIGAFLLELPSGKVTARTEWRLHDHGQYLWALGHGRFLLRVRDQLTMFAPLATKNPDETFRGVSLLRNDRRILAILVSADNDLLTVETAGRAPEDSQSTYFPGSVRPANPGFVQINFYRLVDSAPDGKLVVASAGVLRSRVALNLPLTTGGFLDVLEGGKDRWLFNFDSHAGKTSELAEFHTTCYPRAAFVSHSEFVAFGCRGSSDKQSFAGFNLKGEEMWQQNFYDTQVAPTFAFAPAVGRFALGRTLVSSGGGSGVPVSPGMVSSQEVRVYQMYNGKQLFRMDCTPIMRAGQNYALSPDGLRLAMVRETVIRHPATKNDEAYTSKTAAVEIYSLPALTDKDMAAIKETQGLAPPDTNGRIDLAIQRVTNAAPNGAAAGDSRANSPENSQGSVVPGLPLGASASPAPTAEETHAPSQDQAPSSAGDAPPDTPRKPPTLYQPGETPQGQSPR